MTLVLDLTRMQMTLNRNLATSYGLTLVVGLPFPLPVLIRVAQLREHVQARLPGRFRWYEPEHLHATVIAPLRGRYRDGPPLQRDDLPTELDGFAEALSHCFSALQPFPLKLEGLRLAPDGRMLAFGPDPGRVRQQVAERLASVPGLDRPKDLDGWHVTLGYLQASAPFGNAAEQASFEFGWNKLQSNALGTVEVDRVWLVHYADRTLSRIVGKAPLLLGLPNALTAEHLLVNLGIEL
jgi:2'-5' RNA ligase